MTAKQRDRIVQSAMRWARTSRGSGINALVNRIKAEGALREACAAVKKGKTSK